MRKIIFSILILSIFFISCSNPTNSLESPNNSGNNGSSNGNNSGLNFISFKADSESVLLGNSVKLTAVFSNADAILYPGNIRVRSETPVYVTPTECTTYRLVLTDSSNNTRTESIYITVSLEGKYEYKSYGPNPITSKFIFFSTGVGNYSWERKFDGNIPDQWAGTFNYTIKNGKIDLYWTRGSRSGTHSYINSYNASSVTFESRSHSKTSSSPYY